MKWFVCAILLSGCKSPEKACKEQGGKYVLYNPHQVTKTTCDDWVNTKDHPCSNWSTKVVTEYDERCDMPAEKVP